MDKNHNDKVDAVGGVVEAAAIATTTVATEPPSDPKISIKKTPNKERRWIRQGTLNIILCADPIKKTRFLGMLADTATEPVCYLDTDLLYAGCTNAGLYKSNEHTTTLCPDHNTWHHDLACTISKASSKKMMVVIDSLNGVYEMFGGPNAAMSANAHIMILASLAAQSGSSVVIGAVVRKRHNDAFEMTAHEKKGEGEDTYKRMPSYAKSDTRVEKTSDPTTNVWVLHPSGRRVPKIAKSRTYLLKGTASDPSLTDTIL